ncbi:recombinase family protein [Rhodocytophaga aerolata]|uniref:Recombinase family protein n=1 Tax=Rhodocytophaga aerolata TaxID=455078 RepID=A0ABT8RHQ1_9BACT|nr:recombinase family protein [Rhodocytophaga aerolata]MDO1450698.1 recombinase family protein [Rhodocytophaga aerolata]
MTKIGYARVSTLEQNLDMQLDALKGEGCKQVFTDKVSGVKSSKPNFTKLMEYLRPGDTIVVWKLDRLGRSTVQLIELIEDLKKKGVNLKSLSESIDTTSATGNLFFQFMCILAEHERNIIRERTSAGLQAARARGRRGGRPKGLNERYQLIAPEVREVYEKNTRSTEEIRKMFSIKSQPTLYKILEFAGADVKGFAKKRKGLTK